MRPRRKYKRSRPCPQRSQFSLRGVLRFLLLLAAALLVDDATGRNIPSPVKQPRLRQGETKEQLGASSQITGVLPVVFTDSPRITLSTFDRIQNELPHLGTYNETLILAREEANCLYELGNQKNLWEPYAATQGKGLDGVLTPYVCLVPKIVPKCDMCSILTRKPFPSTNDCVRVCNATIEPDDGFCGRTCPKIMTSLQEDFTFNIERPRKPFHHPDRWVLNFTEVFCETVEDAENPPPAEWGQSPRHNWEFLRGYSPTREKYHFVFLKWTLKVPPWGAHMEPFIYVVEQQDLKDEPLVSWKTVARTRFGLQPVKVSYQAAEYRWRITAVGRFGAVGMAVTDKYTTLDGYHKPGSPKSLKVVTAALEDNSLCVLVEWEPPDEKACFYKITTLLTPSNDRNETITVYPLGAHQLWLRNLRYNSDYLIGVTSRTASWTHFESNITWIRYRSPGCLQMHQYQFSRCAPPPPTDLQMHIQVKKTLPGKVAVDAALSWVHPANTSRKNVVHEYIINVTLADVPWREGFPGVAGKYYAVTNFTIPGNFTYFTIPDLMYGKEYLAKIQSLSAGGISPSVLYLFSTNVSIAGDTPYSELTRQRVGLSVYVTLLIAICVVAILFTCGYLTTAIKKRRLQAASSGEPAVRWSNQSGVTIEDHSSQRHGVNVRQLVHGDSARMSAVTPRRILPLQVLATIHERGTRENGCNNPPPAAPPDVAVVPAPAVEAPEIVTKSPESPPLEKMEEPSPSTSTESTPSTIVEASKASVSLEAPPRDEFTWEEVHRKTFKNVPFLGMGTFGTVQKTVIQKGVILAKLRHWKKTEVVRFIEENPEYTHLKLVPLALKAAGGRGEVKLRKELSGKVQLINEIRILRRLSPHPQIVQFYGKCVGGPDGFGLVMEHCPGGDLCSHFQKIRSWFGGRRWWTIQEILEMEERRARCAIYRWEMERAPFIKIIVTAPVEEGLWKEQKEEEELELVREDVERMKKQIVIDLPGTDLNAAVGINERDMLLFAHQIAKGMEFLENNHVIHRDLACRNVLLMKDHRTVKVADFGMSRQVPGDRQHYFPRFKPRSNIRWTAVEVLFDKPCTSKSDVWSFGILSWELVTLGGLPYGKMLEDNLIDALQMGKRLQRPRNCSQELFNVMLRCWRTDYKYRPNFSELRATIEELLEKDPSGESFLCLDPHGMKKLGSAGLTRENGNNDSLASPYKEPLMLQALAALRGYSDSVLDYLQKKKNTKYPERWANVKENTWNGLRWFS